MFYITSVRTRGRMYVEWINSDSSAWVWTDNPLSALPMNEQKAEKSLKAIRADLYFCGLPPISYRIVDEATFQLMAALES